MRQAHQQQQQQYRQLGVDEATSSISCNIIGSQQRPDAQLRFDRQIQTSPSDSPAAWPPPSVHGSPRHRRTMFDDTDADGGRCECSSGAASRTPTRQQPSRRDLYRWLSTAEPGARLFRAKYVYRPLRDSPNDNPETELSLTPGDYMLIFGDLDEDYYYRGELWTGERGLVPSNYVEPMTGGVLGLDAATTSALDTSSTAPLLAIAQQPRSTPTPSNRLLNRAASERAPQAMNPGVGMMGMGVLSTLRSAKSVDAFTAASDIHQQQLQHHPASAVLSALSTLSTDQFGQSEASSCPFPVVDVSNVQVQEIRPFDGARVPCPRDLLVERQLTKSVLISWSPPVNALCPVTQYHVCVDGEVRTVVPAGYKTKALIEDVDSRKVHRISVRAISDAGPSPDEACTVTLGRGSLIKPQDLKVTNVTPVSCEVIWYPSHSSCEHLVLLNGLRVGSCPAGVYRVQIRGLIPSTMYRCAIRVKDPKAVLEEKPVESYVDFKTLPKIGLPDPPSDVHCEPGPQDGTLLVTWRPVTTQPKPPSRAAVSGYLVYADGRKVCEVDSPSGDHAVLRLQDLNDDPPLFITVKTKTREGAVSSDSNVVRVPRTGTTGIMLPPQTTHDALQSLSIRTMPTQVAKNASTQEVLYAVGSAGMSSVGQASMASTAATTTTTYTAPISSSIVQFSTTSTTPGEKAFYSTSTSAPSYYVFHPRLASQQLDTNIGTISGIGGVSDLLGVSNQQEKPSLLEMETDYLSRHHQIQERAAAYQSAFTRPGTSATTQSSRLLLQQQQQALAARQAAFGRRSYSLDEAQRGDYDPFVNQQTGTVQILHQQPGIPGVSVAAPAASTFHPIKHLRSAAAAVTAFNGPHQRTTAFNSQGGLILDETAWSDSNPFRPTAVSAGPGQTARFDSRIATTSTITSSRRTGPSSAAGFWTQQQQQSDRLLNYGDFDMVAPVGSIYDNHSGVVTTAPVPYAVDNRTKFAAQGGGVLSSRHRRRLQDAAEARTLSEPDLLHYDVNQRYLVQQPPTHVHHPRRHGGKTHTRLVVALYDYSPRHMSPNPNGHLDELPFRKGQLITVLGDKDADGFYRGELDGRVGLVPGNLVVEVEGGVPGLLNSPPTAKGIADYEAQAALSYGTGGRYRESSRSAPRDRYYGSTARAYGESGVWDGRNGGSDPLLSRSHHRHAAREQQLAAHAAAALSFDNAYDRYSDTQDRYATSGSTARHRRGRYKQKSHSLEYDLNRREEYYDQEGIPYDRTAYPPSNRSGEAGMLTDYDPSSRLAARSLDRFHYQRQQPIPGRMDTYAGAASSGRRPTQPAVIGAGARQQQVWPPAQQGYREGGGYSDQDSEAELIHYHRQQQQQARKSIAQQQPPPPRRMSMFDQQQQQQQQQPRGEFYGEQQEAGWRTEEPYGGPSQQQFPPARQRGATGYDRNEASYEETLRRGSRSYPSEEQRLAEARKQQPSTDYFYDSPSDAKEMIGASGARRRGSLRRGGRQQMEQNIREAVISGAARRMIAKFDYDPKILSPNPGADQEELTFRGGDTILVYGNADDDGFYVGELNGRRGLIPSNYLMLEQDAAIAGMSNPAQLAQPGMPQQMAGMSPQQAMYEAQQAAMAGTSGGRSKKEISFAPSTLTGEATTPTTSQQPPSAPGTSGMEKKAPAQAPKQSTASSSSSSAQKSGAAAGKRPPGQLKKADSTVGQKVPQKKASVAGGPAPGRKASTAVAAGKSGAGSAAK